ncbi:MAG TPA: NUDIX hydrolase [Opitutaceae bacterium]|nr:NUDIX hydrolase [Opitutaceae bacterium]
METSNSTNDPTDPGAWERLGDNTVDNFRIFQVRRSRFRHLRENRESEFIVIDANDWVNVVALTPDHEVVLVRQFRFGRHDFFLEIPGGMIERGEDPVVAGVRELREETGYEGTAARLLGSVHPNPAIQSNTMHVVLVEGACKVGPTNFDINEEIETSLVPASRIMEWVREGKITHSLVLNALFFMNDWLETRSGPSV